jgi:hypothetical protein
MTFNLRNNFTNPIHIKITKKAIAIFYQKPFKNQTQNTQNPQNFKINLHLTNPLSRF